ncbi:MAG: LacI family DNA-binding transcriptional regulator [Magnetovibrio sp.]|nr:LacI family DNA-binding transcriptional regulator [Magnetovibrio sp.]
MSTKNSTKLKNAKAVAERAGVSEMTVSRFFRNPDLLSDDTRQRIADAVAAFNYVPNRMAQNLRNTTSDICALLVPTVTNSVFVDVISEMSIELEKVGFHVMVSSTGYDMEKEAQLLDTVMSFRPAAIVMPGLEHLPAIKERLRELTIPVVEIMDLTSEPIAYGVGFDQHVAQAALMEHLWSKGYRKYGFVGTFLDHDIRAAKRKDAASAFLKCHGTKFLAESVLDIGSSPEVGMCAMAGMFEQLEHLDVLICSNDDIATGVLTFLHEHGIDVPGQIAVVGFNNLHFSAHLTPSLTTIDTRRPQIGRETARLLVDLLQGREPKNRIIDTGFELFARDSA